MSSRHASEPNLCLILITYPAGANYRAWCRSIIERKLAACVNIVNVNSIYWWKDALEESDEVLLIFKTTRDRAGILKEVVMKEHPYEVPEFVQLNVADVSEAYLKWITDSTTQ